MPEKIGKYEVVERIGRGGMGTIFKAHDPVLNRAVAIKVISSEVEVTDDMRARFLREAQACARLSHRNIVTVYDMGEDNGRFFIVMELLEGDELRRIIDQRRVLALEDKLSIMVQVCDGLHYAHEKGIVHRDIKPGNILLLRTGQVKILDFGLAQVANITGGFTRTGLVMGTLRYMSPEQVRGRADHRSDIFSVGAVFYEFLSLRLPFTGGNPMQILEQLRTEEPPSLTRLDPTIPRELAAAVERALRKDPGERFPDLAKMRAELEQVQHGLAEEAQRVRTRVRGQRDHLRELQAALAARIGPQPEDETVIDEREGLAAMLALESQLAGRIETVQAKLARADAFGPAFERGTQLLQAGRFADAVVELEAIVADMPEHARALDGLGQARAQAEAERRRQLEATLRQDARAALDDGRSSIGQEAPSGERTVSAEPAAPPTRVATMYAALLTEVRSGLRGAVSLTVPGAAQVTVRLKAWLHQVPRARTRTLIIAAAIPLVIAPAIYWIAALATASRRLQAEAAEARKHVDASRDRALGLEANTLARDLFDRAVAKDDEARQLTSGRRFDAAIPLLREADRRYEDAGRVAMSTREVKERADQTRTRMLAVKARAAPEAAEFRQALARETEGDDLYKRLAFEEAGAKFLAAAQLFSRAVLRSAKLTEPPRAEPGTVDPRAEIREVLRAYARVFETKDLELLRRIRPRIRPDELSRHRDTFEQTRSYRLNLRVDTITVSGDEAEVRGRREDIVVARNGETFRTTGAFIFPLKRLDNRWTIESIK